jgi:hypothetical protein
VSQAPPTRGIYDLTNPTQTQKNSTATSKNRFLDLEEIFSRSGARRRLQRKCERQVVAQVQADHSYSCPYHFTTHTEHENAKPHTILEPEMMKIQNK